MLKYYVILFLLFVGVLYYVFLQDPCNRLLRADFSSKHPEYEVLDSAAGESSTDSVQCRVYYKKPGDQEIYRDTWLYKNPGDGWAFSKILETQVQ